MPASTEQYRDAFALFDTKGNGRVARASLGDLLRACGQNPTLAEISDLEASVGPDFDFDLFLRILNRPDGFRSPGQPEDFVRGFQVFDKDGSGFIGVGELKYVLTSLGEKLSDDEVEELLKGINIGKDGSINYSEFVQMILAN